MTAKLGSIPNILLTAPLEYPVFVFLLDRCHFVLSDSGGIQEEAPSFGKQVLVLREVTERPEAVDAGFCRLLGSDALAIRAAADRLLRPNGRYASTPQTPLVMDMPPNALYKRSR